MADPYIDTLHADSKSLFGGFHGITEEGLPRYIQDKYEETLQKTFWLTVDGLWSSAASGIVKGAAIAAALIIGGTALTYGALGAGASGIAASAGTEGLTTAVYWGLNAGVATLTAASGVGLGLVTLGAAVGALYDVSKQQTKLRTELAHTRDMMRDHVGVVKEMELKLREQEQEIAPSGMASNPEPKGQDYWKNKVAASSQMQQRGGIS